MNTKKSVGFKFGQLHGNIPLAPAVVSQASKTIQKHYAFELANDFDGEDVEVFEIPVWAPPIDQWWPTSELLALGFRRLEGDTSYGGRAKQDVVMTFGVDQHIDDFHGPLLCYVLHNDGLIFRQGSKGFVPVAGDWFLFNDKANHGVKEAKGEAGFMGWTIPLEKI